MSSLQNLRRTLSFNSPVLIGVLVLFVGLGTYAVLRSKAASTPPMPADGTTWNIHIVGDSIMSGCEYSRPILVGKLAASNIVHDMVGTFKGQGQIDENGQQLCSGIADDDNDAHGAWCSTDEPGHVCQEGADFLDPATYPTRRPIGVFQRIDDWTTASNPDITLFMIGANDGFSGFSQDYSVQKTMEIIDKILALKPNSAVLLGNQHNSGFDQKLREGIDARFANGKRVYLIDVWNGVGLSDGTHPDGSGSQVQAQLWFDAINDYVTGVLPQPAGAATPTPTATPTATATPTTVSPTPTTGPAPTPKPQPAPTTGAVLGLYTPTVVIPTNGTFDVTVKVNTKVPLISLDSTVLFPADKLQLTGSDITPEATFPMKNLNDYLSAEQLATPGKAFGIFATGLTGVENALPMGEYTAMTLHFKALATTGTADITFAPAAGAGNEAAASVLETSGSQTIYFGSGSNPTGSPTPTPTTNPTSTPTPTPTPSPTPTTLPNTQDVNFYLSGTGAAVGQNITVTLGANIKKAINAAEVYVSYDPSKLEYVSATKSAAVTDIPISSAENGEVFLVLFKQGEITGNQALASITFKVLATGSATLDVTTNSAPSAAADGAVLQFSHTPLSLTLGATATPTPTPTTNPTSTPTPTTNPTSTPTPTNNPTGTPTPTPTSGTRLYLTADPNPVDQNGNVTLTLHLNTSRAINAAEVYLGYDPGRLQFVSATKTAAITDIPISSAENGQVFLVLFKQGQLTGDQAVATITFKAIAYGAAGVIITNGSSVADASTGATVAYTSTPVTVNVNQTVFPPTPVPPSPIPPTPVPTARPTAVPTVRSTGTTLPTSTKPVNPTQPAQNQPTPVPGSAAPTRIVATGVGRNTATITWSTAINTTGVVEYGTTAAYGFTAEDKTLGMTHSVTLPSRDLIPGTTYHYRVKALDEKSVATLSGDQTFKTKGYSVVVEVKDQDSKALKGATVTFGTDLKASTDAAGKASFPDAPGGSVQVKVTYNGQNAEKTVTVQDTSNTQTFQVQITAKETKKKTSIIVPIIIGVGLILLIGLIVFGIRYMRGSNNDAAYYDPAVPTDGYATPQQPQAPSQQAAGGEHQYPW